MAVVLGVVVGAGVAGRAGAAPVDIAPATAAVMAGLVIVATVAGGLAPPAPGGTAFAIPGSEAQPAKAKTMRQPAPTKQLVFSMTSSTRFPSKLARTPTTRTREVARYEQRDLTSMDDRGQQYPLHTRRPPTPMAAGCKRPEFLHRLATHSSVLVTQSGWSSQTECR